VSAIRQAEARPIMEALHDRLIAVRDGLSSMSSLTKAIEYTLAHWGGLIRFLDEGRLEADTNIVERSIRPIALGRKNALLASDLGGRETYLASLSTRQSSWPRHDK
jgi:transposase